MVCHHHPSYKVAVLETHAIGTLKPVVSVWESGTIPISVTRNTWETTWHLMMVSKPNRPLVLFRWPGSKPVKEIGFETLLPLDVFTINPTLSLAASLVVNLVISYKLFWSSYS